jgi:hypothetical protein
MNNYNTSILLNQARLYYLKLRAQIRDKEQRQAQVIFNNYNLFW